MQKKKTAGEGDEILQCDTLSTESPSNSFASISPVNGDENEEHEWLNGYNRIGNGDNDEEENSNLYSRFSLNDGVILSHLEGTIDIPKQKRDIQKKKERDNILIAPSTIEERQNERHARKVGINFSIQNGDFLTLSTGHLDDDNSASVESDLSNSPQYGKKDEERTFRRLYGNVSQILDQNNHLEHPHIEQMTPRGALPVQELITPRTRTAMIDNDQIVETLRPVAATLSVDWGKKEYMAPSLARRLRDFEFAQKKRRKILGISRKWGFLALYDFLAAVREDVDWAEDAAWRRANCLPYVRWIDYVQSKKRGSNQPIFVYSLLFACTITLIASIGINGWSFEVMSLNPSFGPSAETLIIMGAKHSSLIVNEYQIWRLFTPMFLHGGIIHYVVNCFAVFYIGRAVEQSHGTMSAAILFTVPAVGSVLLSSIFLPQYISVGASGGIFGLIGAAIADLARNRRLLFSDFINKGRSKRHHALVVVIVFLDIILNLLIGLTPFTDNFMHIGGFLLGILCASTMLNGINLFGMNFYRRKGFIPSLRNLISSKYFGLFISVLCMSVATIALFKGDGTTSPCESCGVLSCVSFPPWTNYDSRWWYCDSCGDVKAIGMIDEVTLEYYAIEIQCPDGEDVILNLGDDIDKSYEALEKNLPMFCRTECLNK